MMMANQYIPLSPLLQKLAPGLINQPNITNIPGFEKLQAQPPMQIGDLPGAEPSIPGQNVPIPEPTEPIRNQKLQFTPNTLNDLDSVGNQFLQMHDLLNMTGFPNLSPLEENEVPTAPRPLQEDSEENFENFFPEDNIFTASAPQVDAIFGLSGLRKFIRPQQVVRSRF